MSATTTALGIVTFQWCLICRHQGTTAFFCIIQYVRFKVLPEPGSIFDVTLRLGLPVLLPRGMAVCPWDRLIQSGCVALHSMHDVVTTAAWQKAW